MRKISKCLCAILTGLTLLTCMTVPVFASTPTVATPVIKSISNSSSGALSVTCKGQKSKYIKGTKTRLGRSEEYSVLIECSTDKKFKKDVRGTYAIASTKNNKITGTVTGLKKGKTYYVRVRSHLICASIGNPDINDCKMLIGKYSSIKKVKITK